MISKCDVNNYLKVINDDNYPFDTALRRLSKLMFYSSNINVNLKSEFIRKYIKQQLPPHYFDHARGLNTVDPSHFDKDQIFVLDENDNSLKFSEYLRKTKYFESFCDEKKECFMLRVYADAEVRNDFGHLTNNVKVPFEHVEEFSKYFLYRKDIIERARFISFKRIYSEYINWCINRKIYPMEKWEIAAYLKEKYEFKRTNKKLYFSRILKI
jgi:hypothetical protein